MVRILRNSRMDSVKRAAIFFIAFPPSTDIGPQKEIMGLSSAAARCGLYTASRIGFSSNRQLSVLPALNAYKPTLHVLFFCFVSHYNSAACNIQFLFQENLPWSAQLSKKESCEAGFSACGGSQYATCFLSAAVRSSRSFFYVIETKFPITKKSGRCALPLFIIIICFFVRNREFSKIWLPHWNVSLQEASGCHLMPDWH